MLVVEIDDILNNYHGKVETSEHLRVAYREFSGINAIKVVVANGADVDGAAQLPDKQPLVEFGVE